MRLSNAAPSRDTTAVMTPPASPPISSGASGSGCSTSAGSQKADSTPCATCVLALPHRAKQADQSTKSALERMQRVAEGVEDVLKEMELRNRREAVTGPQTGRARRGYWTREDWVGKQRRVLEVLKREMSEIQRGLEEKDNVDVEVEEGKEKDGEGCVVM